MYHQQQIGSRRSQRVLIRILNQCSGDLPTHLLVLSHDLYLYLNLCILWRLCLFVTFVYLRNHPLSEKLPKHLLIILPVLYCLWVCTFLLCICVFAYQHICLLCTSICVFLQPWFRLTNRLACPINWYPTRIAVLYRPQYSLYWLFCVF